MSNCHSIIQASHRPVRDLDMRRVRDLEVSSVRVPCMTSVCPVCSGGGMVDNTLPVDVLLRLKQHVREVHLPWFLSLTAHDRKSHDRKFGPVTPVYRLLPAFRDLGTAEVKPPDVLAYVWGHLLYGFLQRLCEMLRINDVTALLDIVKTRQLYPTCRPLMRMRQSREEDVILTAFLYYVTDADLHRRPLELCGLLHWMTLANLLAKLLTKDRILLMENDVDDVTSLCKQYMLRYNRSFGGTTSPCQADETKFWLALKKRNINKLMPHIAAFPSLLQTCHPDTTQTPLHYSLSRGDILLSTILLCAGARADDKDLFGAAPLVECVHKNDVTLVRLLLAWGAREQWDRAIGTAIKKGHKDMCELLEEHVRDAGKMSGGYDVSDEDGGKDGGLCASIDKNGSSDPRLTIEVSMGFPAVVETAKHVVNSVTVSQHKVPKDAPEVKVQEGHSVLDKVATSHPVVMDTDIHEDSSVVQPGVLDPPTDHVPTTKVKMEMADGVPKALPSGKGVLPDIETTSMVSIEENEDRLPEVNPSNNGNVGQNETLDDSKSSHVSDMKADTEILAAIDTNEDVTVVSGADNNLNQQLMTVSGNTTRYPAHSQELMSATVTVNTTIIDPKRVNQSNNVIDEEAILDENDAAEILSETQIKNLSKREDMPNSNDTTAAGHVTLPVITNVLESECFTNSGVSVGEQLDIAANKSIKLGQHVPGITDNMETSYPQVVTSTDGIDFPQGEAIAADCTNDPEVGLGFDTKDVPEVGSTKAAPSPGESIHDSGTKSDTGEFSSPPIRKSITIIANHESPENAPPASEDNVNIRHVDVSTTSSDDVIPSTQNHDVMNLQTGITESVCPSRDPHPAIGGDRQGDSVPEETRDDKENCSGNKNISYSSDVQEENVSQAPKGGDINRTESADILYRETCYPMVPSQGTISPEKNYRRFPAGVSGSDQPKGTTFSVLRDGAVNSWRGVRQKKERSSCKRRAGSQGRPRHSGKYRKLKDNAHTHIYDERSDHPIADKEVNKSGSHVTRQRKRPLPAEITTKSSAKQEIKQRQKKEVIQVIAQTQVVNIPGQKKKKPTCTDISPKSRLKSRKPLQRKQTRRPSERDAQGQTDQSLPAQGQTEESHSCDVCSLSFATSYHLDRHRQIHAQEDNTGAIKRYECKDCQAYFHTASGKSNHRTTYHAKQ